MTMLGLLCLMTATAAPDGVVPLPRAHAHNDYVHERPLFDALDHGFCSIEADVFTVNDDLWIGHDKEDLNPERTLRGLYLAPLLARAKANGGRIYPGGPTVILLVDIKSDGNEAFPVLKRLLEEHRDMLTVFHDDRTDQGAVSVVVSGSCPRELIAAESPRLMAIDGRPGDLDSPTSPHLIPLISTDWPSQFRWTGRGGTPIPETELAKLREFVGKAHAQGQFVRFWALPPRPEVWQTVYDAGLDLINADRLDKLRDFLLAQPEGAKAVAPEG